MKDCFPPLPGIDEVRFRRRANDHFRPEADVPVQALMAIAGGNLGSSSGGGASTGA